MSVRSNFCCIFVSAPLAYFCIIWNIYLYNLYAILRNKTCGNRSNLGSKLLIMLGLCPFKTWKILNLSFSALLSVPVSLPHASFIKLINYAKNQHLQKKFFFFYCVTYCSRDMPIRYFENGILFCSAQSVTSKAVKKCYKQSGVGYPCSQARF